MCVYKCVRGTKKLIHVFVGDQGIIMCVRMDKGMNMCECVCVCLWETGINTCVRVTKTLIHVCKGDQEELDMCVVGTIILIRMNSIHVCVCGWGGDQKK